MELAYIAVDPSYCNGLRFGLWRPLNSPRLIYNSTTVDPTWLQRAVIYAVPPSESMTALGNMGQYKTMATLALCS